MSLGTSTPRLSSPGFPRNNITPMATGLPSVEFGFENLKDRMNQFTLRFDEFIERGRRRILEEKNGFAKSMAEDKDRQRSLKAELDYFHVKDREIHHLVEKENIEAADVKSAIAGMERKKRMKDEHKENLLAQIDDTKQAIEKKRLIRATQRQALALQQSRNAPELAFWEDHLGMKVEGAGIADHLKITYTHLNDPDWSREFWFVVSMVARDYEVTRCRPKLDPNKVAVVVDKLNDTREFSTFLKDMRNLFKNVAVS